MVQTNFPDSVDLASYKNRVLDQGMDNSCGPHAMTALFESIYTRLLGELTTISPQFFWNAVRFYRGLADTNTGADFPSIKKCIEVDGIKFEKTGEIVKGFQVRKTDIRDSSYTDLKRLLCLGYPIILELKLNQSFYALGDKRDWRQHHISTDTSSIRGQHYVCLLGYDDSASRWLCENSWGSDWADGGFFGIPYSSLQFILEAVFHVNVLPVVPKIAENFILDTSMTDLFSSEKVNFVDACQAPLRTHLTATFQQKGAQALIDECALWGVTDKHLENLMQWPRYSVQNFFIRDDECDWAQFQWSQK